MHALAKMEKQVATLQMNMGLLKRCVEVMGLDQVTGAQVELGFDNEILFGPHLHNKGKGLASVGPNGPKYLHCVVQQCRPFLQTDGLAPICLSGLSAVPIMPSNQAQAQPVLQFQAMDP